MRREAIAPRAAWGGQVATEGDVLRNPAGAPANTPGEANQGRCLRAAFRWHCPRDYLTSGMLAAIACGSSASLKRRSS
jgi:hypothetical protein